MGAPRSDRAVTGPRDAGLGPDLPGGIAISARLSAQAPIWHEPCSVPRRTAIRRLGHHGPLAAARPRNHCCPHRSVEETMLNRKFSTRPCGLALGLGAALLFPACGGNPGTSPRPSPPPPTIAPPSPATPFRGSPGSPP